MTQDATMVGGLQRKQGLTGVSVASGTTLEITSGGALKVESGGTASIAGAVTIASGGSLAVASGAYTTIPVETATTTAAMVNFGVSLISSTAADHAFSLAAPTAAGMMKIIASVDHGATTITQTVKLVGCKVLGGTTVVAGTSVIGFLGNTCITLVSLGTTSWAIAAKPTGDISFA